MTARRLRELEARRQRSAREALRARRELEAATRAGESMSALQAAGAQLMFETDVYALFDLLCRELARLGLHAAVLTRSGLSRPQPFRYQSTSFAPPLQRVVERALGHPLSEIELQPRPSSLLERALRRGRAVKASGPQQAARQLLGASDPAARRIVKLLGLRQVVVAPLRWGEAIAGALVVVAPGHLQSPIEALEAFANQASIALDRARLLAELHAERARLSSEVARRTGELRRAVEALREIDRRKDNFLANVSHELRTPLVTVLGYTDLLLGGKLGELDPRQRTCLEIVAGSGQRLRSFIEELLDFSRHELTRDQLNLEAVDVGALVGEALESLRPRFQERGVRARLRVARATPPAWGDRRKLVQVLTNLLVNAERHGRPSGRVRVAVAPGAGGGVRFGVRDDGEGIPPAHLEHLFDRLYQVGDAATPRGPEAGLGLGLSIARGIVHAHGGRIEVRSRVGRGTRFAVSLPGLPAAPRAPPPPPTPPPPPATA